MRILSSFLTTLNYQGSFSVSCGFRADVAGKGFCAAMLASVHAGVFLSARFQFGTVYSRLSLGTWWLCHAIILDFSVGIMVVCVFLLLFFWYGCVFVLFSSKYFIPLEYLILLLILLPCALCVVCLFVPWSGWLGGRCFHRLVHLYVYFEHLQVIILLLARIVLYI